MTFTPVHGSTSKRRATSDRRAGADRRSGKQPALTLVPEERRAGKERRRSDRRSEETASEHIRNSLQLLATVSQTASLDEDLQRDLDSAIFRLRFALDRLEHEQS
jgi:hypothetical protein